jgi:alpha-galactosidase
MMMQRILTQRINHLLLSFLFFSRLFSCNFLYVAYAVDNGLGLTPPMGWNSWNRFGCNIHEQLIHETSDAAVSLGLDKLGYAYINLDDCWQLHRNSTGFIVEDLQKFPSGIDSLSEYVHSKGLKFGLYSDAGLYTCQKRPGSLHYEVQDAASYTEWKIDYLKYDNCWSTVEPVQKRYQTVIPRWTILFDSLLKTVLLIPCFLIR